MKLKTTAPSSGSEEKKKSRDKTNVIGKRRRRITWDPGIPRKRRETLPLSQRQSQLQCYITPSLFFFFYHLLLLTAACKHAAKVATVLMWTSEAT